MPAATELGPTEHARSQPPALPTHAAPAAQPVQAVSGTTTQAITQATRRAGLSPRHLWPALLLALVAGWLLWRRSHRLAQEAHQLTRRHRALMSINNQLKSESRLLREQATNDPLTGALNRSAFGAGLREVVQRCAPREECVHLLVIDLDRFKAINDSLGHMAGDSALKLVTGIAHEQLVSDDLFGRFGGDEFMIACTDRDTQGVLDLAEAIRADVEAAAPRHSPALPGLTLSIGVACADPVTGYDADALFARADEALYEAKRQGRNRVVLADTFALAAPIHPAANRHL